MADPTRRVGYLGHLLDHRRPGWADDIDATNVRAGGLDDVVGHAYRAATPGEYDAALFDLGIHAGPGAYGLAPSMPGDTLDDLTATQAALVQERQS